MSLLASPSLTSRTTSRSVGVSDVQPLVGRLRWPRPRWAWHAHSGRITAIERLGGDVAVTGDATGLVRVWWLPDRSLMTEASLGAAITTVRVVDEDQILVGTESGLALLRLKLPLTHPA